MIEKKNQMTIKLSTKYFGCKTITCKIIQISAGKSDSYLVEKKSEFVERV